MNLSDGDGLLSSARAERVWFFIHSDPLDSAFLGSRMHPKALAGRWRKKPNGCAWGRNDLSCTLIALGEHALAEEHLLRCVEIASRSQSVLHVLTSFRNLAELRMKQGQTEQAAALASFVRHHPGCEHHVKLSAQQLLEELRDQLPKKTFSRLEEQGKGSSLDEWFEELMQQGVAGG